MQIFSKGFVPDICMRFTSLEPEATQCISKESLYDWAEIGVARVLECVAPGVAPYFSSGYSYYLPVSSDGVSIKARLENVGQGF
jgi:hypothetical protein